MKPIHRQIFYASAPLLNMLVMGMQYGYSALLNPSLIDENSDIHVDENEASWIISIPGISGVVSVLLLGYLMHHHGRRTAQLVTTGFVLTGWILTSISYAKWILVLGRIFIGVAKGGLYLFAISIGEVTNPSLRGVMLACKTCVVTIGVAIIHASGYFLHWRPLALVAVVPTVFALFILLQWPETPDWLVSKHRFDEARDTFYRLRGVTDVSRVEIDKMIASQMEIASQSQENKLDYLSRLRTKAFLSPMILLFLATLIPEIGGKHFFPAYSLQLAQSITGEKSKGFTYTFIVDSIMVIAALSSTYWTKRFDRRLLFIRFGYLSSTVLVMSSTIMYLRVNFFQTEVFTWISSCLLGLYFLLMFSTNFPICYMLMGELLPLQFRDIGSALMSIISCILLVIVLKIIPLLKFYIDVYGMFFMFSIIMFLALIYMDRFLPETRNRTLHDIGEYFEGRTPKSQLESFSKNELSSFIK